MTFEGGGAHSPRDNPAEKVVTRAFKYRLYPTAKQHGALREMLSAHAEIYNAALQERRDAWRRKDPVSGIGTSVRATSQMVQLREIRRIRPDQARWSFTSQQQTLRRLDKAFAAFFRRVKTGEAPGYPRFRSAVRFDSVDFRHGDGLRLTDLRRARRNSPKREARVFVQGVGSVRMWMHRDLAVTVTQDGRPGKGQVGQVSIKREGGTRRPRWYVVIPVEIVVTPAAAQGRSAGIDLATGANGLAYVADTDGAHARLENPRYLNRTSDRLAFEQRSLARKQCGSKRRQTNVDRIARLHTKVRRSRLDYLHKAAASLVDKYDLVAVEALQIANMTRRPRPKPGGGAGGRAWAPNGAAQKSGLNKSILDSGWGIFLQLLHAKAESAGRVVVPVDPRRTSQTCSSCGHHLPDARVGKTFTCSIVACAAFGRRVDSDVNAARNILRAGLAQHQPSLQQGS